MKTLLSNTLFVLTVLASGPWSAASAAEIVKPIRALLISGGCCHDYSYQAKKLVAQSTRQANIKWTVLIDPRKGTEGEIDLYNDPNWAKDYDVVIHNECFAKTKDPKYIRKITEAHKAGTPAVVIHCAMHTYRDAEINDWREFLGVTSKRHEHQSKYPVRIADAKHPVMIGIPADWKTPADELYKIEKVWPNTKVLATSNSERTAIEHAVFWTNEYGKARVFGTTYGHGNATWDDPVFCDAIIRGTLWAADKLGKDGKPLPGYESKLSGVDDWAHSLVERLPASENPVSLFNGRDLTGWNGCVRSSLDYCSL